MARTITCNVCGKEFNFWDEQHLFKVYRRMGYGTKYDGDMLELDMCCDCMDTLIDKCKVNPIKSCLNRGPSELED